MYRKLGNLQELFIFSAVFFHEIVVFLEIEEGDWYNRIEKRHFYKRHGEMEMKVTEKNIYLIGFMGAGKSTIARALCKEYGLQQMEMDAQIEQEEKMKISEIFEKQGEEYFRFKETALLERCTEMKNLVVSCGGGAAMRECNVKEMKKNGKIVLLSVTPETVYERVKNSHDRPLLEGHMNVEYIRELLEVRRPKYEKAADIIVKTDGKTAKEIAKEIMMEL